MGMQIALFVENSLRARARGLFDSHKIGRFYSDMVSKLDSSLQIFRGEI